jgi:hypothetical protein
VAMALSNDFDVFCNESFHSLSDAYYQRTQRKTSVSQTKGNLTLRCWWVCPMEQLPWHTVWRVLKKVIHKLVSEPTYPLLDMYPKELMTSTWADVCKWKLMAKAGNLCPPSDWWLNKCDISIQ